MTFYAESANTDLYIPRKMAVRKRIAENVSSSPNPDTCGSKVQEVNVNKALNPLMQRGLELYEEVENSGFDDSAKLESSLGYFLQAAENGVEEAGSWIGSFLSSLSMLPPSVVLPGKLVNTLQWVTEATPTEKQVRSVARSMFSKMAEGKDEISCRDIDDRSQLLLSKESERHVHQSSDLRKSAKLLKGSIKRLMFDAMEQTKTNKVTEEAFSNAAVCYARGELATDAGEAAEFTPEELERFKNANFIKKVTEYPKQTLRHFKHSLLKTIEHRGVKWIWSSFPTKQFYLLLIAYLLPMLNASFIISSIFTVVFVCAFIAMIVSTLQVILNAEKVVLFMEYSSIFQYFSDSEVAIDTKAPESNLIKKSAGPYITFAVSLTLVSISLGLSHHHIISYELLSIVAGVLSCIVFLQFRVYESPLVLLSVSTRLISWSYVFLLQLSTVVSIPEFLFFSGKQLFSVPVFPGVWLGINVITLLQLPVQVGLIVLLLYRETWHNFFSGLGPYSLFVCWWVLCRNFFSTSSPYYLVMTVVGVCMFATLFPLFPIVFLVSPVFFYFYYGVSQAFFISISLVIIVSVAVVFATAYFKQLKEAKWLNIPLDHIFLIQILLSILVILLGSSWYASMHSPSTLPTVSIGEYTQYCGPLNWNDGNMVQTQLNCLHLQNRVFEGHGVVDSVKIAGTVNDRKESLKSLPSAIQTTLTCFFGQSQPMCGDREDMTTCIYAGCNFQHNLHYQFEIKLDLPLADEMQHKLPVSLMASNKFRPVVEQLKKGMDIAFNASFVDGMGSDKLTLQASTVHFENNVLGEQDGLLEEEEEVKQYLMTRLFVSIKLTASFLLEVLLGYTPSRFYAAV